MDKVESIWVKIRFWKDGKRHSTGKVLGLCYKTTGLNLHTDRDLCSVF